MKPRVRVVRGEAEPVVGREADGESLTLAERVHRALRRDIIAGHLPAGQALRLEFLKERYGISFSPLREALNRLQSERLVLSTPSRGFRVAPFSEEEMWDVIETRILIDCEALRRSLVRGDAGWEARLIAAFEALNDASGRAESIVEAPGQLLPDPLVPYPLACESLEARHRDFHESLISACGSRWLLALSAQLYAQTERYRQPTLRQGRYAQPGRDVGAEHRRILDAAVARDAVQAAGLLARHYRETGRLVSQGLRFDAAGRGGEAATRLGEAGQVPQNV